MSFVVVDGVHYEVLQDTKSAIQDFYKSLFTIYKRGDQIWMIVSSLITGF